MFLAYADESGFTGQKSNPEQPVLVVGAIMPNVYRLHKTQTEFGEIVELCEALGISLTELKAEQIYRGRGPWRGVDYEDRDRILEVYLTWLSDRGHKILISAIDNKEYFSFVKQMPDHPCAMDLPYPYLAGALHIAMMIQKLNKNKKKNKGRTILIFDQQDQFENHVTSLICNPPDFTDPFCNYDPEKDVDRFDQIVDTAYFVRSHQAYLAQVADVISYIARLYIELNYYGVDESYEGERQKVNCWYSYIEDCHIGFNLAIPRKKGDIFDFLRSVKAKGTLQD